MFYLNSIMKTVSIVCIFYIFFQQSHAADRQSLHFPRDRGSRQNLMKDNAYENSVPEGLPISPDLRRIVNKFSWDIFHASKLPNNFDNLVLSPVMVQLLLSVLMKAAAGETKVQLQEAIGTFDTRELLRALKNGAQKSKTRLEIATGMFVESNENLNRTFVRQAKRNEVDVFPVQFRQNDVIGFINKWTSDVTHGLIPSLLSDGYDVRDVQMVLASAIYFQSTWKYRFNTTGQRKFNMVNNVQKRVPFMELDHEELVFDTVAIDDEIKGVFVEIPYQNENYSMVVLLPEAEFSLDAFIRGMTWAHLEAVLNAVIGEAPRTLTLKMPKFDISTHFSLTNTLLKLGLVDLFTTNAKLPYIGLREPPQVSDIFQKAVLKVDEIGTTASAATGAVLVPLSAEPIIDHTIIVDRPFLAIIFDKANRIPLFISKVYNP